MPIAEHGGIAVWGEDDMIEQVYTAGLERLIDPVRRADIRLGGKRDSMRMVMGDDDIGAVACDYELHDSADVLTLAASGEPSEILWQTRKRQAVSRQSM